MPHILNYHNEVRIFYSDCNKVPGAMLLDIRAPGDSGSNPLAGLAKVSFLQGLYLTIDV